MVVVGMNQTAFANELIFISTFNIKMILISTRVHFSWHISLLLISGLPPKFQYSSCKLVLVFVLSYDLLVRLGQGDPIKSLESRLITVCIVITSKVCKDFPRESANTFAPKVCQDFQNFFSKVRVGQFLWSYRDFFRHNIFWFL